MNLEDLLRQDAASEHDNPLAGRGGAIAAVARRRRRNRQAGVGGVAVAAAVAVALLVPGSGWDGRVVDPATSDPGGPVTPVQPVSICELTTQDLAPGDLSDVDATLTVAGGEVTVTLTNAADQVRTVREVGNEVWLVDASTSRVVAYQADLRQPIGMPIDPGSSATVIETLALTPCADEPLPEGGYVLYARGSVPDSESWLAGPVGVALGEVGIEPAPGSDVGVGALRPELCEVPWANVRPLVTPGASPGPGEVLVSSLTLGYGDDGPVALVTLANTADSARTAWVDSTELFFVDRWTMETVGYAASDGVPDSVHLEPGTPTALEQPFQPRACNGDPLPDGWYLLYARGSVAETDPWLAEPTLIGWVDGEPGTPPSDAATEPDEPEHAAAFDPHTYPWEPPATSDLEITGWMLDVPLSGAWDGADTIQEILTVTNTGPDRITATVWAWVILVEPDGEVPMSIAVEPRWELPIDVDLAPGESMDASAVHWLGRSSGEDRLPDAPLSLPGTYDAYVVLVDIASYDPATSIGWSYGVGGPFSVEVD